MGAFLELFFFCIATSCVVEFTRLPRCLEILFHFRKTENVSRGEIWEIWLLPDVGNVVCFTKNFCTSCVELTGVLSWWSHHLSDLFTSAFFSHPANAATRHSSTTCLLSEEVNNALVVKENCPQCRHIASKRAFFALGRFVVFQCEDLALVS